MRTVWSRPVDGWWAVVQLADDDQVEACFADDGSVRDVTMWAADLLLAGVRAASEVAEGVRALPVGVVEVGQIQSRRGTLAGMVVAPDGTETTYSWDVAGSLIAAGIAEQVTAGVAAEIATTLPDVLPDGDLDMPHLDMPRDSEGSVDGTGADEDGSGSPLSGPGGLGDLPPGV